MHVEKKICNLLIHAIQYSEIIIINTPVLWLLAWLPVSILP